MIFFKYIPLIKKKNPYKVCLTEVIQFILSLIFMYYRWNFFISSNNKKYYLYDI